MEKIICFDTSITTSNMGDYIIAESCDYQLENVLLNKFVIRFPTHTPIAHWYQDFHKTCGGRYDGEAKYKFLYGTNLLNHNMFIPTPAWNINLFNSKMARDVICVGVGLGSTASQIGIYTKCLLRQNLNANFMHSTRDERTAEFLRNCGLKAINTGCATTWNLTNEHCAKIPEKKADAVIFTLTDYMRDKSMDYYLINTLKANYKDVYFWVQGVNDYAYLTSLTDVGDIKIIPPSLAAYSKILDMDIDYVGTRLHAGIKALQKCVRTIIIEIDNRAMDMNENISLPIVKRTELTEQLESMIHSSFATQLNINTEAIDKWRNQFDENR